MQRRILRRGWPRVVALFVSALALSVGLLAPASTAAQPRGGADVYINPLPIRIPGDGFVENCADPSVIRGQEPGDKYWYMYCTTDPLNDEDRDSAGNFNFHKIPMMRSLDLVNWVYMGDAFAAPPAWADPTAGVWAPEIDYIDGLYYLFYGITNVKDEVSGEPNCNGDNAIGYATSKSPLGPWQDAGGPLVAPRQNGDGCNFFWTFDPEVIIAQNGQAYIYYGSYYGGVFVRQLQINGPGKLATDPATEKQVTIANRYEGPEVVFKDGYYYLFVSATDCCRGPLTGYSVFAGRSTSPEGPFVDREGVSLMAARVGGTPVLSMNGNRWVGPGHNTVFVDFSGQWWTIYHAVDRFDPYFEGAVGFTKRPALLDPIDWINGWPTVRAGRWASDEPMPAPAAQPGERSNYYPKPVRPDLPGQLIRQLSDEFNRDTLSPRWKWVREPDKETYGVGNGVFRFDTQAADLFVDNNTASVLTEPAPPIPFIVETRVKLNLPAEGCCFNYVQAGLVIYRDDDNFVKLVHVSIWETRQTEFAKEVAPVPDGYPRYGNTVVGPPDDWTYLRIARDFRNGEEHYTAYTSRDGRSWVRGGTWTHNLGPNARIGLVSMGGSGFTAEFDYVRVFELYR